MTATTATPTADTTTVNPGREARTTAREDPTNEGIRWLTMVDAYVECAISESRADNGEPMDEVRHNGPDDELWLHAHEACDAFVKLATAEGIDLKANYKHDTRAFDDNVKPNGVAAEALIGRDLWMSRNGDTSGFYLTCNPNCGQLCDLADTMGKVLLYIGGDGYIYPCGAC